MKDIDNIDNIYFLKHLKEVNVFDVANYIIVKSKKITNNNLNHMKLQRLIYYSYIKYLLKYNEKLLGAEPMARIFGPIFDDLYYLLSEYYEKIIIKPLIIGRIKKIDSQRQEIIDEVLELCKDLSGYDLTQIAHKQAPQYQTRNNMFKTRSNIITDKFLKGYFSRKTNILETDRFKS